MVKETQCGCKFNSLYVKVEHCKTHLPNMAPQFEFYYH